MYNTSLQLRVNKNCGTRSCSTDSVELHVSDERTSGHVRLSVCLIVRCVRYVHSLVLITS